MLRLQILSKDAAVGLENDKRKLRNSYFISIVRSTALARATVIDNIKKGMSKNLGWPPFKPETIAHKRSRGRSIIGLVDSGRMMTSIHEKTDQRTLSGEVFPGVNYLVYQERGTKDIPERPTFEPVPEQINKKIETIFQIEVARALNV